jgi:DNA-directed RNA polymerase specialized sigma subunit
MSVAHKSPKTGRVKITSFKVLRNNRVSKDEVLRFRVDSRQKQYWLEAIDKLHVEFSSYVRQAVDRAIAQDLRSSDPKWQEFMKAIQPVAKTMLGHEVSDNAKDRLENLREIEAALAKANKAKGK